jgi:hypothetical protein
MEQIVNLDGSLLETPGLVGMGTYGLGMTAYHVI